MGYYLSEFNRIYILDSNKRTDKTDLVIIRLVGIMFNLAFCSWTNRYLMTERIILSIVAILMLAYTFIKGDKRTILLTAGLTIGILITWVDLLVVIILGMIINILTALMISAISLKNKGLNKLDKTAIVLAGIFTFVSYMFSIMHLPYAEFVRLSMIIPIGFFIVTLIKGIAARKEFGYLTIMNVDFFLRLIR